MKYKRILVTGGAGYVGAKLVPRLLQEDCDITVLDLMIYGEDVLPQESERLNICRGDIRDRKVLQQLIPGHDAVIHLACISNDPSFELNPALGKSINKDAFEPLVDIAKNEGVARFIYASSSSVYGIKKEDNVNENMALEPLTDYSKFKAECEEVLNSYISESFEPVTIRPATVCGYSKRQRLDVVVNILTNLAYNNREITIFGGEQLRPNIHIDDMIEVYQHFLRNSGLPSGAYNAGFENMTVLEIAESVKREVGAEIVMEQSNDPRSYRLNSDKLLASGFKAKSSVLDAVKQLKHRHAKGELNETDQSYTVGWMKMLGLGGER